MEGGELYVSRFYTVSVLPAHRQAGAVVHYEDPRAREHPGDNGEGNVDPTIKGVFEFSDGTSATCDVLRRRVVDSVVGESNFWCHDCRVKVVLRLPWEPQWYDFVVSEFCDGHKENISGIRECWLRETSFLCMQRPVLPRTKAVLKSGVVDNYIEGIDDPRYEYPSKPYLRMMYYKEPICVFKTVDP